MTGFSVPAQLVGIRSLADRGLSLSFHTAELTTEEKTSVMGYHMDSGWLLYGTDPLDEKDLPSVQSSYESRKTPSQRLRAVIYLLWKQKGSGESAQEFYDRFMEKLIDHYKSELID